MRSGVGSEEYFSIRPFGEDRPVQINRQELAHIIEARVAEIFSLTLQEIKRSGYDGLLPAGMVLTGGTSALPGIKRVASEVLEHARPHSTAGEFIWSGGSVEFTCLFHRCGFIAMGSLDA